MKTLVLVPKHDPILREIMPEELDFKDPALQQVIQNMSYSILPENLRASDGSPEGAAGMAANQWGIKRRVFIFSPYSSAADQQEIVINPSYVPYLSDGETEPALVPAYEGCFSIPLSLGLINRYEAIVATYYNVDGKKVERYLEGWEARVFQHETDHLDGKLYDGRLDDYNGPECLDRVRFKDEAEMDQWIENFKAKSAK